MIWNYVFTFLQQYIYFIENIFFNLYYVNIIQFKTLIVDGSYLKIETKTKLQIIVINCSSRADYFHY